MYQTKRNIFKIQSFRFGIAILCIMQIKVCRQGTKIPSIELVLSPPWSRLECRKQVKPLQSETCWDWTKATGTVYLNIMAVCSWSMSVKFYLAFWLIFTAPWRATFSKFHHVSLMLSKIWTIFPVLFILLFSSSLFCISDLIYWIVVSM